MSFNTFKPFNFILSLDIFGIHPNSMAYDYSVPVYTGNLKVSNRLVFKRRFN